MLVVDARGLCCPMPMMMTLDAVGAMGEGELVVLVDDAGARESVERAARSLGLDCRAEKLGNAFRITIGRRALHCPRS